MTDHFEIQRTADGSDTVYSHQFRQQYHDTNGAIDESRHVFLDQSGFNSQVRQGKDAHILEVGFGTGLNLLLVAETLLRSSSLSKIVYTSIEGYPLDLGTVQRLNYPSFFPELPDPHVLSAIFSEAKPGLNRFQVLPNLEVNLFIGLYDRFKYLETPVDVVFFDAFSPKVNPELWSATVFHNILDHASNGCVLATYCAAVSARAAMCHAGWLVARGPGFKTRREMTIASNAAEKLGSLPRVNELRYASRYANGEFTH